MVPNLQLKTKLLLKSTCTFVVLSHIGGLQRFKLKALLYTVFLSAYRTAVLPIQRLTKSELWLQGLAFADKPTAKLISSSELNILQRSIMTVCTEDGLWRLTSTLTGASYCALVIFVILITTRESASPGEDKSYINALWRGNHVVAKKRSRQRKKKKTLDRQEKWNIKSRTIKLGKLNIFRILLFCLFLFFVLYYRFHLIIFIFFL